MSWGLIVPVSILWAAATWFFRHYRVWIVYYLLGTVGLAYLIVAVVGRVLMFEPVVAHSVAIAVHNILNFIGIESQVFLDAPGVLLVLVITQDVGWTALQIGVESSGLLEMAVLFSLVMFYPGWQGGKRLWLGLIGISLTWAANVARMVLIAFMLHFLGKDVLVLAHTFLGKIFFFAMTIAIYWMIVTSTTLKDIRNRKVLMPREGTSL
ncbi:MAG: hypothetical protein C0401_11295 [Anaerolinea sp.]|nr:hypothetical protein [Anaerolinea sp.]